MSQAILKKYYTVEEYYALEEKAEFKSEYYQGEIYPLGEILQMAGGTPNHSLIAVNTTVALASALSSSACRVFNSDQKIMITENGFIAYPDITVTCGLLKLAPGKRDTVIEPVLIVEVVSASTASYDRGLKSKRYRASASLQAYLLVEQEQVSVDRLQRSESGKWVVDLYEDLGNEIELSALNVTISLEQIYRNIKLEGSDGQIQE